MFVHIYNFIFIHLAVTGKTTEHRTVWHPKSFCTYPTYSIPKYTISGPPLTSFRTGTTGYIGGDSLFSIAQAHPDWKLSVLVRSKEKGAKLASEYPQARVVYGDLDSADIIEEEVKNADIVYRTYYYFMVIICWNLLGPNHCRLCRLRS